MLALHDPVKIKNTISLHAVMVSPDDFEVKCLIITTTTLYKLCIRPGKVDLQFIVKAFLKKHAGGRSFFTFHCQKFLVFKNKFNESHSKICKS